MEKVLILEGLDCPHCAEEIRSGVEKIEGVEKAVMNFMAKKLSYYVHKNEEEIYLKVLKVIKDVEPGVTVLKEKAEEHNHGKKKMTELIVHNLCCANCAEEIRREVEKMDGVSDVTMNFMAKKMTYCSEDDSDELFQKIKTYIEEIELGAKVERVEAPKKHSRRNETELILKNLDCPHCAEEIRSGVEKLEGVSEVTMNFMAKKLSYHADRNNTELYEKIIKVIKDVEPDIEVVKVEEQEKRVSKTAETELILKNLCCPNCAEEIRSAVEKLDGIEEVTMNFMAKKLSYRVAKGVNSKEIYENVVKIVKQVEPGVEVEKAEPEKKAAVQTETKKKFDVTSPKVMIVRIAIALVITILTMVMGENLNSTVEFILTLFAYIVIGGDIVWRAVKNILRGKVFDENFLMSLATVCAFIIRKHSEAVAVMLFYQVGEYFQSYAVRKSRKSITELMDIRPDYANVKIGDEVERMEPDEVEVDDIIVVKAGEKVPLDGIVVKGHSSLDTSALTGESVPRDVFEGDSALSGCINQSGILEIKVTKPFAESTVSKILKLVENSGGKKAQTEKFITKFSKWYTPAVVISALLLALVPPIIMGGGFTDWIYRGLSFLVVSCPCALVVSVPLSFFGGIGGASKAGILVKGSNYLEALSKCDTIVFDKTGTLTEGSFTVTEINPMNISEDELLKYATVAEWNSNHPIAVSIKERYNKETFYNIDSQEIAGRGIKAMFQGNTILAGNLLLMKENDIFADNPSTSGTVVHIAVNGEYKGNIVISDRIKKDSMLAVSALKNVGVNRICMLTGDNKNSVKEVAGTLGITEYYSDLLPGDKVDKLEEIMQNKKENSVVAFVGDGINDTPVLARADIGIAMGALGSDAAIEVADIVLMHDEPSKIAIGKKIAKKTIRIVNENIVFAIGVKIAILICIALGVLGDASMWWAVFGDVGVAFIAILNAIRALHVKNIK